MNLHDKEPLPTGILQNISPRLFHVAKLKKNVTFGGVKEIHLPRLHGGSTSVPSSGIFPLGLGSVLRNDKKMKTSRTPDKSCEFSSPEIFLQFESVSLHENRSSRKIIARSPAEYNEKGRIPEEERCILLFGVGSDELRRGEDRNLLEEIDQEGASLQPFQAAQRDSTHSGCWCVSGPCSSDKCSCHANGIDCNDDTCGCSRKKCKNVYGYSMYNEQRILEHRKKHLPKKPRRKTRGKASK